MHTISASICKKLTLAYLEIQVYFIKKNTYFEEDWFGFLDNCDILLDANLIKANDLQTILNQVNPFIHNVEKWRKYFNTLVL